MATEENVGIGANTLKVIELSKKEAALIIIELAGQLSDQTIQVFNNKDIVIDDKGLRLYRLAFAINRLL